ncbi:MAG: hypothetical protein ACNS61_00690 [Candidatus Wenzhouxiangella sp. M2_3B_020]
MTSQVALDRSERGEASRGERVRVPLLERLLSESGSGGSTTWCDFGPVQGGLIRALSGRGDRMVVADLPAARAAGSKQWHRFERIAGAGHFTRPVDRFLCWNLLDYMSPDQLRELAGGMAAHGAPGCRVHALICYSSREMAAVPGPWPVGEDLTLAAPPAGGERTDAPRYSPKALEKAMPALRVERTMLLNNGMQEFVFELRRVREDAA